MKFNFRIQGDVSTNSEVEFQDSRAERRFSVGLIDTNFPTVEGKSRNDVSDHENVVVDVESSNESKSSPSVNTTTNNKLRLIASDHNTKMKTHNKILRYY